jgi:fermentation-respiration switch protein FrsA (DUF1100 family)
MELRKRTPHARRVFGIVIATAAALYFIVCVVVYFTQARMVWYPGPPPETTPLLHGLPFDDWRLEARDGALVHAWRIRTGKPRGAVILCHGNAGNIASRIDKAAVFAEGGFDVVLFDYRGYGLSTGELHEEGTYIDAETVWSKLVEVGFDPSHIVAFGESLGGAVAIELARRRRVGALVVEDTFTSLTDMARRTYPWLPVRWILRSHYASEEKIGALSVPVLVIHSPEDELIPVSHGRALFESAREPKAFLETGGPHNGPGFGARPNWRASVIGFVCTHASRM